MPKKNFLVLAFIFAATACGSSNSPNTSDNDAGNDSGGGPAADAACTASAQAQCALRDSCSTNHYLITRTYGDMATCVAKLHDSCVAGLAAPGTGNSPANVMACASTYSSISCVDYLNGNTDAYPAACKPQVGSLANGSACRFNGQCQSTFCAVPTGLECGSCAALPTTGTACNGPGAVSACGGHLLDCAGAISDDRGFIAGACQPYVTTVGGSCDTGHPCGEGLSCTPVSTTATGRTCQTAGNTVGAACGGATNPGCDGAQGFSCNGKTHMCQQIVVASAGTACGSGADGSFTNCLGDGDCMGATSTSNAGTCRSSVADGAACDFVAGPKCASGSICVTGGGSTTAGTCTPPSAATCH
jgi:hypothetical protein